MEKLNLPECVLRIKSEEGNDFIFDIIRKKYLVLTPEEWVRQHFIHLMVNHLSYPKSLIRLESGLHYHKSAKRSDILLLDRKSDPFLLVECKSANVHLTKKVVDQIAVYNKVTQSRHIAITNGLTHFVWKFKNGEYQQLNKFPSYPD